MDYYKKVTYRIADVNIQLCVPEHFRTSSDFYSFLEEDDAYTYQVQMLATDKLPLSVSPPVYEDWRLQIFEEDDGTYYRRFIDHHGVGRPYAISRMDKKNKLVKIEYLSWAEKYFGISEDVFVHIGLESILLSEGCLALHASCIQSQFGGILFSGPSGIGKSTQADLWCQYENARLLNGDRPILKLNMDGWNVYGSPYAGSSKCYLNEHCKIRAIVLLKQAKQCNIRRLHQSEAFRKVFANLTINIWDSSDMMKACDLAVLLTLKIPIYEMACTPDIDAVELLCNELKREAM